MQTSVHPVSYDSQSFLKIDFPKYDHKFSIQESVCIKSKQSSNVTSVRPNLSLPPFSLIVCTKTIQLSSHATFFWMGMEGLGAGSGDLTVIFAVFKHSASLCRSCSSRSCSSRSWYVSQEAGGVRL